MCKLIYCILQGDVIEFPTIFYDLDLPQSSLYSLEFPGTDFLKWVSKANLSVFFRCVCSYRLGNAPFHVFLGMEQLWRQCHTNVMASRLWPFANKPTVASMVPSFTWSPSFWKWSETYESLHRDWTSNSDARIIMAHFQTLLKWVNESVSQGVSECEAHF